MKNVYEAPNAEVINFASMEQLATLGGVTLGDLDGELGLTSKDF